MKNLQVFLLATAALVVLFTLEGLLAPQEHFIQKSKIQLTPVSPKPPDITAAPDIEDKDPEAVMRERAARVKKKCQTVHSSVQREQDLAWHQDRMFWGYRANDTERFHFFLKTINKCGFSSWKLMLHEAMTNAGYNPANNEIGEKIIPGMQIVRKHTDFKQYAERVLFVRSPYDRLVSAYKNRVIQAPDYIVRVCTACVRRYGGKKNTVPLTFEQFVRCCVIREARMRSTASLSSYEASEHMDAHWKPEVYLSLPCYVNYTLIGEFNNFSSDVNASLKVMNLQNYTSMKAKNQSPKSSKTLSEWYSQLDDTLRNDVKEYYKYDFLMFGYDSALPRKVKRTE